MSLKRAQVNPLQMCYSCFCQMLSASTLLQSKTCSLHLYHSGVYISHIYSPASVYTSTSRSHSLFPVICVDVERTVTLFVFYFSNRYKHFLQDLTANTSPDNPEFQQLSSRFLFLLIMLLPLWYIFCISRINDLQMHASKLHSHDKRLRADIAVVFLWRELLLTFKLFQLWPVLPLTFWQATNQMTAVWSATS